MTCPELLTFSGGFHFALGMIAAGGLVVGAVGICLLGYLKWSRWYG